MKDGYKKTVFAVFVILLLLFFSSIRSIITPFLLAAVIATLLGPVVRIVEKTTKLPHSVVSVCIYLLFIGGLFFVVGDIAYRVSKETDDLNRELRSLQRNISQTSALPMWMDSYVRETVRSIDIGSLFTPRRVMPYFSGALTGASGVFVFLVSLLYFLMDGTRIYRGIIHGLNGLTDIPESSIRGRVHSVLERYVRGQILLVLLMMLVSFIILSILKVRFAFLLALFTGVVEIIPMIGPTAATIVAAAVALFDGVPMFSLAPEMQILVIIAVYFLLRQLEDIFVIPYVMGRATNLHPLFVLFIVLMGGQLLGVFGMILAVPLAALVKSLLDEEKA